MKLALQVLAYDVDRFINPMIKNAGPWVDRIYLAYPDRPFGYIPSSRETKRNPTQLEDIEFGEFASKIEVLRGDWEREEDTRNACLDRAREAGYDWMIIQDADEFYPDGAWQQILKRLETPGDVTLFRTTWYTFWKSSQYVLEFSDGTIKSANAGFAVRCTPEMRFIDRRQANASVQEIIDEPCYHYGYVKSDAEILEKVSTWSHAHEVRSPQIWFECKWQNWNLQTRYLSPTDPVGWKRAIPFPYPQPPFSDEFDLNVAPHLRKPMMIVIKETCLDIRIVFHSSLRKVWRAISKKSRLAVI